LGRSCHCDKCGRLNPLSDKARAKLHLIREKRRYRRGGEIVLSGLILVTTLSGPVLVKPFASLLVAAALATTAAFVLVPPRARKSQAGRLLSPLAGIWLLAFGLGFGGYEGIRFAERFVDLERSRSCDRAAAVVMYKQAKLPGTVRTITCGNSRLISD
jgi:hypothetical protein